jgi:predicted nucleic acid-binding Zn ribbon protein
MANPLRKPTAAMWQRHALISQWRGASSGPLIDYPARTLGSVLEKVVKDLGLSERMNLDEVVAVWQKVAGDYIAKQTTPESCVKGVLLVRFVQPTLHFALQAEKPKLLAKLKEHLGHNRVRDIRFRHG